MQTTQVSAAGSSAPGAPTPNDLRSFLRKLINYCRAALMCATKLARFYSRDDLAEGIDAVKWFLDWLSLTI